MVKRAVTDEEKFALLSVLASESELATFVQEWLDQASAVPEQTGVGFVTTIVFPRALPPTSRNQWDWNFRHALLPRGGSFICYREEPNSLIIEAVSFEGDWPSVFDPAYFGDAWSAP